MFIICLVTISILIQLSAAFLAFRLIKATGKQISWAFIALAMVLQASRRIYTLVALINGEIDSSQITISEWIGLAISVLMLIGVLGFGIYLKRSNKSNQEFKLTEEKLFESEFRFTKLWKDGPFGMMMVNQEFQYTDVNPMFCRFLGYSESELQQLTFKDISHPDDLVKDTPNIRKLIDKEISVYKTEKRYIRKDGQVIWGALTVTANYDKEGQFLYNLAIVEDITRRKQAEEELRKSKKLLSETESIGKVGGWEFNIDTLEQTWTDEVYRIHEVDIDFNPNVDQGINFYAPASRPIIGKAVQRVLEFGEPFDLELEIITAKGNLRKVHTIGKPDIENRRVYGFFQDITERKLAEEQLHKSEQRFSSMFNLGPVAKSLAKVSEMVFCDFNKAAELMFEINREEVIGKFVGDFDFWVNPEERLVVRELLKKQGFVHDFEFQFKKTNDNTGWASGYSEIIEIEGEKYSYNEYVDITARKEAEKELRERENKLGTILNLLPVGISILDQDQKIVYANPALENIMDITMEGLYRGNYSKRKYLGPDMTPMSAEEFASTRAFSEKKAIQNIVTGVLKEDGTTVWTNVSAMPVDFPDWKVILVTADITELKQAEEEIRQLNERLATATKSAQVGIWDWDIKNDKLTWDDQMYALYGLKKDDFKGAYESWVNGLHPEDKEFCQNEVRLAMIDEKKYDAEFRIIWPDGTVRYSKSKGEVFRDETGIPKRMVGVNYDITERKLIENKLKESEEFLKLGYEAASLGIWRNDLQTMTVEFDEQARIHYGFNELVVKLSDVIARVHPDDMGRLVAEIEKATGPSGSGKYSTEYRVIHPDGSVHWLYIGVRVKFEGEGESRRSVMGYGTSLDITERKQVEEKIKKLNEELEKRVIERTSQLEAANKELEAFSYSVSHDLRAPLRGINGFAQILMEDFAPKLDDEAKRICSVIQQNSQKMGRLIDELLAFSRLSRSEMQLSEIDMSKLIQSIYQEFTDDSMRKKIELKIDNICNATADTSMMKQVWVNLLLNAVKYSSKREKPVITITCKKENEKCIYCIKDNGVGFDMAYVDKLFGVFQRLHTTKEFEGTGVGLAIVQRIVHRHGGKVWAEGEVDKGASFYFSLPIITNISN